MQTWSLIELGDAQTKNYNHIYQELVQNLNKAIVTEYKKDTVQI